MTTHLTTAFSSHAPTSAATGSASGGPSLVTPLSAGANRGQPDAEAGARLTGTSADSPANGQAGAGTGRSKAGLAMTPKAAQMAKQKLAKRGTPDAALRIGIKGGGCSGYSYVLEFADDPPRERDRVFTFDGLRVYVDPKSLVYLAGTTLDWEHTLMFQGFKFRNPNESSSCGCGLSFSVG